MAEEEGEEEEGEGSQLVCIGIHYQFVSMNLSTNLSDV